MAVKYDVSYFVAFFNDLSSSSFSEIIAEGKHDELIKSCEAYRKLSGTEEKSSPHLEIDKTHVGFAGL